MTDQKSCNIKNCQCPHHQNEADFVVTDVIEVDPKNSANFQIPKKHLGDVEKVIVKKNTKTMKKKVELFGNAKPEPQPKKPKKPPTDQQIIEQLADLNHKFEFIVEQFQILNETVQNESQKNEEFRNKQEKWNQKQEQKIDELKNEIKKVDQKVDQKINDLEEKFNQKIDDIKVEIKKVDQKVDAGFAQVNQRLDKIENCPTIKKELAEQEEDNINKNEKQKQEDS